MNEKHKSIYRISAENGRLLAPLMLGALVCIAMSLTHQWCSYLTLVFMLSVPFVLGRTMRRTITDNPSTAFSTLWLQGICTMFFGALLLSPFMYVALGWIWPDFFATQINNAAQMYQSMPDPQLQRVGTMLTNAVQQNGVPAPSHLVLETVYSIVFSGTFLSGLLALTVRLRGPRAVRSTNSNS